VCNLRLGVEEAIAHYQEIIDILVSALVFIMREAMIGVYQRYLQFTEIISLAVLLLVIGGIRTLAITYSPGKVKEGRKDE